MLTKLICFLLGHKNPLNISFCIRCSKDLSNNNKNENKKK